MSRHLNFQKRSNREVHCVLPTTTLCTFSTPTSKRGPGPSALKTFDLDTCFAPQLGAIVHLSSAQMAPHPPLERAYFSTLGATNHWNNTVFRNFPTFSRTWIFLLLTFSSLIFFLLLFSDSSHLFFSSVHIVRSLTSKLPSITLLIQGLPRTTPGLPPPLPVLPIAPLVARPPDG